MSRKRKSENVAQYFSQAGCDGLRQFVTSSGLSDLSGCDELARERLISAVKVGFLIFGFFSNFEFRAETLLK